MVTNSAALGAVADGSEGFLGGLRAGKLFIDMSTVSPAFSREIAAKVREKGADMVDSPVSGSVITLQEGKLSVMVGGRRETFEGAKPLLLERNRARDSGRCTDAQRHWVADGAVSRALRAENAGRGVV
jgi:3-hydroxyisobutyrate dehydrogenase-like beta-hydroxyacid dehydrogenase